MILGDVRHFEQERHVYPAAVQRGVQYIIDRQLGSLEPGKYELEGDMMFALVQAVETRPAAECRPESHATYTDIQYLAEGLERIGVCRLTPGLEPVENDFAGRDIAFYGKVEGESELALAPGSFAVFFPSDVHRPCCQTGERGGAIKKVVIKIHRALLEQ